MMLPGRFRRFDTYLFTGESLLLLLVPVVLITVLMFLPVFVQQLIVVSSAVAGLCAFFLLFSLWHFSPGSRVIHSELSAHRVIITFDRVVLASTSIVTTVIGIVMLCVYTVHESTYNMPMSIATVGAILYLHTAQTFFMIWLMDTKKIRGHWVRFGKVCRSLLVAYNLFVFLVYAFYANKLYDDFKSQRKLIIVVSFFVATSFCDLAIHLSEVKFVHPSVVEENGVFYEPIPYEQSEFAVGDKEEDQMPSTAEGQR